MRPGLGHGGQDLGREPGRGGPARHMLLAAEELAQLLEHGRAAGVHEQVAGLADGGVGRDPAGAVGAAALGADDQLVDAHRRSRHVRDLGKRSPDPLPARRHRLPGPAQLLDHRHLDRSAGHGDGALEARAVELLAAQRDQQHGPHVRVGAQLVHHVLGVGRGIAAGEADELDALLLERGGDRPGHMVRALDEVGDEQIVADALASVGPQPAMDRGLIHDQSSAWSILLMM